MKTRKLVVFVIVVLLIVTCTLIMSGCNLSNLFGNNNKKPDTDSGTTSCVTTEFYKTTSKHTFRAIMYNIGNTVVTLPPEE